MINQGEIDFNAEAHTYVHVPTGKKLTPVSTVIKTVYSTKSWDGVKPEIVENAKLRGIMVDGYMTEFIRTGTVDASDAPREVQERLIPACHIFDERFCGLMAVPQVIVYSLEDGIAGTMDFYVDGHIVVDLKATYSKEKDWTLQLGAYSHYSGSDRAGIIHISPKVYKEGGRWFEYDATICRAYWHKAVEWWKETKLL